MGLGQVLNSFALSYLFFKGSDPLNIMLALSYFRLRVCFFLFKCWGMLNASHLPVGLTLSLVKRLKQLYYGKGKPNEMDTFSLYLLI